MNRSTRAIGGRLVKDGREELNGLGRNGWPRLEENPGKIYSFFIHQPLHQNNKEISILGVA